MDPFTQHIQRVENNDKVREIVTAFRLIPINDNAARDQLEETLTRILTPAAHKYPKHSKKSQNSHLPNQTSRTTT